MDDLCLHESNIKSIFQKLTELVLSGKRYRIVIKVWKDKRTVDQNSLNWMWCTEIAQQANKHSTEEISPEDVHEFYKKMFCPEKEKNVLGQIVKIKSTKLLDTGEMHFYLNQIEYDAHSKGLTLTIPANSEYKKLKDKQVA
ncbi:hypothetical protein [Utexia brackfieldae]|uniref:hypothetical protein n=1 Tax=Utexia brackfieldae TaxID=3074108 RepID=UPI00370DD311